MTARHRMVCTWPAAELNIRQSTLHPRSPQSVVKGGQQDSPSGFHTSTQDPSEAIGNLRAHSQCRNNGHAVPQAHYGTALPCGRLSFSFHSACEPVPKTDQQHRRKRLSGLCTACVSGVSLTRQNTKKGLALFQHPHRIAAVLSTGSS